MCRSPHPTFLDRVQDDYLQAARALIAREFGVLISMEETMLDIMYFYSEAVNKRNGDPSTNPQA